MKSFTLGRYRIGRDSPPFIIAEMSANHNQSLEQALALVEAAAAAGAQALKLQTYTPDTMTLDIKEDEFLISDPESPWQGQSLYDLYRKAYTPWEWHGPIFERCRQLGLVGFSTPFDESAVDFLESLDLPCYKIASFEVVDLPLIKKAAATGRPLIISTGMATLTELDEAVQAARSGGCRDLVLLKCTSQYPASPENTNLSTIPHLERLFSCPVGLSDHTCGIGVSVAAVALGAVVLEKHFTLSRAAGGVDAAFSLEPGELRALVSESRNAWQAIGAVRYGPVAGEEAFKKHRRSLYVVEDLKAGDVLNVENVRAIRPGNGLAPKYLDLILGKKIKRNVSKGTPLSWELLL